MAITHGPSRPKDVVEIVAAHPVVGPRYGKAIGGLKKVLLGLLGREALRAFVFACSQNSDASVIGLGIRAFVCDDFLCALKKPPFFWVGPELIRRIARGESPLLSNREMRERNAKGGLNVVTWEGALCSDFLHSV